MANELDFTEGVTKFGNLERGNLFRYPSDFSIVWIKIKEKYAGGLNAAALDDGIQVEMTADEEVTRVNRVTITSED